MTWEQAVPFLRDLVVAIISGGGMTLYYNYKAGKRTTDQATDSNIRGELWVEVRELRKAEDAYIREKIECERKIMLLERDKAELTRLAIEQDEEIKRLNAEVEKEKRARMECEGRWARFTGMKGI